MPIVNNPVLYTQNIKRVDVMFLVKKRRIKEWETLNTEAWLVADFLTEDIFY